MPPHQFCERVRGDALSAGKAYSAPGVARVSKAYLKTSIFLKIERQNWGGANSPR